MSSLGTKLSETAAFQPPSLDAPFPRRDLSFTSRAFSRRQWLFVIADLSAITSASILSIGLRFSSTLVGGHPVPLTVTEHFGITVLYAVLILLFANTQGLYSTYQPPSRVQEFLSVLKSILIATFLLGGCLFVTGVKSTSRLVIGVTAFSTLLGMVGWRNFRRHSLQKAVADGLSCHNVLIVGTTPVAVALAKHLTLNRHLGYVVVGHVGYSGPDTDYKIVGNIDHLRSLCRTYFVDEVFICAADRRTVMQVVSDARESGVGVRIIPDLYDGMAFGAQLDYLGDFPSMTVVRRSVPAVALKLKRTLDLLVSASALLFLSPLMLLMAVIIKLNSPGPVFYSSKRVGRKGRTFPCHKFRTMVVDAENQKSRLHHLNERDGVLFKITNDPRITSVGRLMRKYSLDEIPQLWNVFKGDMSLVGPRPPMASEVKQYQLDYLKRLEVAPGITGLWQVEARNNPSFEQYISLDLNYVDNWSLGLDLQILLRTIAVVAAGTGS